jgi:hypothetical protein
MRPTVTADDIRSFCAYLRACTDAQVRGVYAKERGAGRDAYAALAEAEAARRGISLND